MISILTLQSVCVSRNYFDSLTKFILDLYLASLDASAKLFFFHACARYMYLPFFNSNFLLKHHIRWRGSGVILRRWFTITHRHFDYVLTETKADIIDPLPRNLPTSSLSVIIVWSEYSTHDKSMTRSPR